MDTDLKELVIAYTSERSAYMAEQYLNLLVARSTTENFQSIIDQMFEDSKFHELDVSLYINHVAKPAYKGLSPVINELRKTFKDKDAIEDLDEAEAKIKAVE